ncbi:MAG: carbohydrate kinase, partial [Saprospiraceae bacterium]|nr:carbohydrate kinase [Saprospiraceae bacterium]
MSHILILDVGKTNKKCLVFDETYKLVFEEITVLPESADEDGYPCEDIHLLSAWAKQSVEKLKNDRRFQIQAVNIAAYGASFVCLGANLEPLTPLYNYLKPFPEGLKKQFYDTYGTETQLALETASPTLGSLNSGLQLYRIKHKMPEVYRQIKYALHLPQFLAFLLHGMCFSEMTSIGCHTMLWDFGKKDYHQWVYSEGIDQKMPPLTSATAGFPTGLHDSSSALAPYLAGFSAPFVLISTGTWCISLNPFNNTPLTPEELLNDCLCYLTPDGRPVKAARYFGGYEHEQAVQVIAHKYGLAADFYMQQTSSGTDFMDMQYALDEYAGMMTDLVEKQVKSTRLAIGRTPVKQLFVDGGFSKNSMYMNLLATSFPDLEVFAAEAPQSTALGAALLR